MLNNYPENQTEAFTEWQRLKTLAKSMPMMSPNENGIMQGNGCRFVVQDKADKIYNEFRLWELVQSQR